MYSLHFPFLNYCLQGAEDVLSKPALCAVSCWGVSHMGCMHTKLLSTCGECRYAYGYAGALKSLAAVRFLILMLLV